MIEISEFEPQMLRQFDVCELRAIEMRHRRASTLLHRARFISDSSRPVPLEPSVYPNDGSSKQEGTTDGAIKVRTAKLWIQTSQARTTRSCAHWIERTAPRVISR